MQITEHTVASFNYQLTDDSGEVLDTSEGRDPLAYVHGTQSLIPALEKELDGKSSGDSFQLRIAATDAYGERDDAMIRAVERSQLPADAEIEIGTQFQTMGEGGPRILTVVGLEGDMVSLDANHPLAGVALNFDVTIVEVRVATPEEIEHRHVHGAEGHEGHEH